jgi:hypothetical protein
VANSPKGVLGGGSDRSSVREGGLVGPIFGDGRSSRWGLSDDKKQSNGYLATSSSFPWASIAASGSGRRWHTVVARVQ